MRSLPVRRVIVWRSEDEEHPARYEPADVVREAGGLVMIYPEGKVTVLPWHTIYKVDIDYKPQHRSN